MNKERSIEKLSTLFPYLSEKNLEMLGSVNLVDELAVLWVGVMGG